MLWLGHLLTVVSTGNPEDECTHFVCPISGDIQIIQIGRQNVKDIGRFSCWSIFHNQNFQSEHKHNLVATFIEVLYREKGFGVSRFFWLSNKSANDEKIEK